VGIQMHSSGLVVAALHGLEAMVPVLKVPVEGSNFLWNLKIAEDVQVTEDEDGKSESLIPRAAPE
jgi:hypothetical protein